MGHVVILGVFVADTAYRADRMPVMGETVLGNSFSLGPGGKGSNQAVAISRAGGKVSLIARIGDDHFANIGLNLYQKENVNTEGLIIAKGENTGSAAISVDKNGMNSIIVVPGAASGIDKSVIEEKIDMFNDSSLLLTGYEIPLEVTNHSLNLAKKKGLRTILNPAPFFENDKEVFKLVDYLTPNEHEASSLTKVSVKSIDDARVAGQKICELGVGTSIITLGEKGIYFANKDENFFLEAYKLKKAVIDTTGAGDAFNGAFAVGLASDLDTKDALTFANKVAGISTTRLGAAASMPFAKELENN